MDQPQRPVSLALNRRACAVVEEMLGDRDRLGIASERVEGGGRVIDAGVHAPGGIEAGLALARLCLAGLGSVAIAPGDLPRPGCPRISVATDHPVAACMASQYAGWQISVGKFFAMGSGPMRAAHGKEELFDHIGCREKPGETAGVLEASSLPGPDVFRYIAERTGVGAERITLAVARTRSIAGTLQVVARSVETAMHKLHTLGFDLGRVQAGFGHAPLPPPAKDDLAALGRTNDSVLYGARVTLWVRGDEDSILAVGPKVPSSASRDHGAPFAEIFERYGRDFYRVDPGLFSPAEVSLFCLETGRAHTFGRIEPAVLESSFFG